MYFSLNRKSATEKLKLLNDLIRSFQHLRRNRQVDLFRCFQVDDQLELLRLLDGQVGGLGAFENLIDVITGAPP